MKGKSQVLEIDKCVVSRLWYTTLNLLFKEINTISHNNYTRDEILEIISLIQREINSKIDYNDRWIIFKILNILGVNNLISEKPDYTEFRLSLNFLRDDHVSKDVEEELLRLFKTVSESKTVKENVPKLSENSLTFLNQCLEKWPSVTCGMIKSLLCIWSKYFTETDTELQNLYQKILRKFLGGDEQKKITEMKRKNPPGTSPYSSSAYKNNHHTEGILFSILSKLEITDDKNTELMDFIFPKLFDNFKSRDVSLSLYARRNSEFYNEWITFSERMLFRNEIPRSVDSSEGISDAIFNLNRNNVDVNSIELAYRTIKTSRHWILDILDILYDLMATGNLERISQLLSVEIFRGFWPILFFEVLRNLESHSERKYPNTDEEMSSNLIYGIKFVIDKCDSFFKDDGDQEIWNCVKSGVENNLEIVNWVLKNKKKDNELRKLRPDSTIKQIFRLLIDNGVLSTLKTATKLHEGSLKEIENLLTNSEESLATFKAYRSMLYALKSILLSDSYSTKDKEVGKYLKEMKNIIDDLLPVEIRIETMENVFSMLFLRHEDFYDDCSYNYSEESAEERETDDDNDDKDCGDDKKVRDGGNNNNNNNRRLKSGFIANKFIIRDILHCLKTSVSDAQTLVSKENCERNLDTLNLAICDAIWRLEILTGSEFLKNVSKFESSDTKETDISSQRDKFSVCGLRNSSPKSIFYEENDSSSSEDDFNKSEIDLSSDAGSGENFNPNKKKFCKKSNSNSSVNVLAEKSTITVNNNSTFILNLMLSSKESLVVQSIWKFDFDKAEQVIEMFNSGDTQLDAEVKFSKSIYQFREKIKANIELLNTVIDTDNKNSEVSTLQNIRQAVKEGIQTSRLTGQLETFLASNKSILRLLNPDESNTHEILTISILDLALTIGRTRSCSLNACEVAKKYLKSCKALERTPYSVYFNKILKLFYEVKAEEASPLPEILCDVKFPLSIQKINERSEFWKEIDKVIRIFINDRSKRGKLISDDDSSNETEIRMNLLKQFIHDGENYLDKIFTHLSILRNIIPRNILDTNFDGTHSAMLELSIHSYFGYQFFQLGIKPEEIDIVAKKIGVNLVHSILVTCCPKFTFNNNDRTEEVIQISNTDNNFGYTILNDDDYRRDYKIPMEFDTEKPNDCVSRILSELLTIIERHYCDKSSLGLKDLRNLSKDVEIVDTLGKTSCLKDIDLCELAAGNETLTFFINLWNLMFLHSLIGVWSLNTPINKLQHHISASKISYLVGDLGLVTVATLRAKLLGNLNWDFEHLKEIDNVDDVAWQDLDIDQDPRAIFIMANEFWGSPALSVYDPKKLDEALNKAIGNYISCYNSVDEASNDGDIDVCWLPEAVRRYQDFLLENSSLARQNIDLNFVESFTLRKYLNTSKKNVEFRYTAQIYRYELRMNYSNDESVKIKRSENSRRFSNANHQRSYKSKIAIDDSLLQYFEENCWLLSYLVKKINEQASPTGNVGALENAGRCSCLENLLRSEWTEVLKNTFDENQALIGMHENVSRKDLWNFFESLIKKDKLKYCLKVLNSLPDNLIVNNKEIHTLKDKILSVLISDDNNEAIVLVLIRQIRNIHVLSNSILSNFKRWSLETSEKALNYIDNHSGKRGLSEYSKLQITSSISRIESFKKMKNHLENNSETKNLTWYSIASQNNKIDSFKIVKSLIESNKFHLCFEWLKFHNFSIEIQSLVTKDLLIGLLENDRQEDFEPARKLLEALPLNRSLKLSQRVLKKLESISAIKFLTNYLLDNNDCGSQNREERTIKYYRILISIEILSLLDVRERSAFLHLLKHPLLMLEQLLMNGKFDVLNKILNSVTVSENLSKSLISLEDIDKVVRYYAGKSLEFRIALQRDGMESKSRDSASLNNSDIENTEFVMPIKVPKKEEWVPNDKSRVCSCCKSVVFSMFNRRHHCRRCGRVVCAVCSQQRMRVETYPDSVHVRVCDDCKRQTIYRLQQQEQQCQGAPSTPSSEIFDYWRLTTDKKHNQTLKDEFSYEYAPSISLCLAILNLHSDHKAYASFLLDRCDEIKQLLRPVGDSGRLNPEVDDKLLVKMIRSLLVAAKVKCAKLFLNTGLDNCDRILSHIDLLSTLVQSDCSAFVPCNKLDDHALRRLRDLLTEKEQWILALDVSTKSGLDRQCVWAAWGKAYLKIGYYDQARDKFNHCLEKVLPANNHSLVENDWVLLNNWNNHTSRDKIVNNNGNRPMKNPPLLNEILQIIEGSNFNRQQGGKKAVNPLNDISFTLNNIKAVSQGRYYDAEATSSNNENNNLYYNESLYYLLSYGSNFAILEFYIKNSKLDDCLAHVIDGKLDCEVFFNCVYLHCLKNGCVDKLHDSMKSRDPSLAVWKNHIIYTCHCLEVRNYLNTLYQLQIFTKDYIRASMSCIKFYSSGSNNYTELYSKSEYLYKAQKHLETELEYQSNFNSSKRKKSFTGLLLVGTSQQQHPAPSSSNSNSNDKLNLELEISDIDRHINTISRQIEIAKFLRNSEQEKRNVQSYINQLHNIENDFTKNIELPTLFGTQLQKTQLAVLAIICGRDVEEGFGIAFRIIQDYNLRSEKVYSLAGHILASEGKIHSVEQLVKCCRSSGAPDTNSLSDRVLAHCVKLVLNSSQQRQIEHEELKGTDNDSTSSSSSSNSNSNSNSNSKDKVDSLIKLITDLELKISMCIESRQLKTAYLLAVRHSRAQDVRKIYKEADRLGQNAIKSICAKWLQRTQKFS